MPSLDSLTFVVVENPEKIKSMILGDSSGSVIVIAPSKRRLSIFSWVRPVSSESSRNSEVLMDSFFSMCPPMAL